MTIQLTNNATAHAPWSTTGTKSRIGQSSVAKLHRLPSMRTAGMALLKRTQVFYIVGPLQASWEG
jgi:hypothetical protein